MDKKYPGGCTIRFDEELRARLEQRAEEEGRYTSDVVRRAVRLYLGNEDLPKVEKALRELRDTINTQMWRCGGNLNQISMRWTRRSELDEDQLRKVHAELQAAFGVLCKAWEATRRDLSIRLP